MKRKARDSIDSDEDWPAASTPKRQKTANDHDAANGSSTVTPSKRPRATPKKATPANGLKPSGLRTPTQKSKAKSLFSTPRRSDKDGATTATPSRAKNADRSAKRKSARVLFEQQDEDEIWDGADRLAEEILDDEDESYHESTNEPDDGNVVESVEKDGDTAAPATKPAETPKRRAGRPKGAKNKRSPTPEGELPPHERYFFQNRPGPPRTSNNTLSKVSLLTHEEYFECLSRYEDPLKEEKEILLQLHHRSFPQWNFEFREQFNICLYGYGSKRRLVQQFADWLYRRSPPSSSPIIVMVNGYTPGISVRSIFATIVSAVLGDDTPSKLGAQPSEVLEFLQSALQSRSDQRPVTVLINSIDAPPLRRAASQALLARLAAIPSINMLATADTPNFTLMWDVSLRDQFNFVFHDCTTFAPYDAEWNVVDEVHNLLGRKGRRVGGKEGVAFVLKSLPENARNLYRLLLTELLTIAGESGQGASDDEDNEASRREGGGSGGSGDDLCIEFRTLYQKASEEFIASSEMMFRTLLKEFHDHQMITSRIDGTGTETLGVPLSREEMEAVLEDLVLN
ncbi:Origin recognition complex [Rasamsonia emersonii CBS 393.64]|uniref:Origin recognition complex subunit 2 n=1 Tax=Rasamsonia emersonii (strain ATCC 16479 / CBS 393.64 / IMI 116815) TaxID=1408163 RepID=A0A0F4YGG3_RASE3|nr:Origin recognition complex [Rasamsonia emersonii CBS 393.64]KKA16703.1 Origin recognition complex [Rasamsonia emersonii CBS 393.64]